MRVSVVIATKNRAKSIERCIASLQGQKRLPDEVIVIDASTNDDTKEVMEKVEGHMKVVYVKQEKGGLPRARNAGVKSCSGDIVVFLDDDVVLEPLYLEEMLAEYTRDGEGKVGGVTGVLTKRGHRRRSLEKFLDLMRMFFFWNALKLGRVTHIGVLSGLPRSCSYVEAFYGHNMSFRREVFSDFEFDEELEIHPLAMGEDVDFSYRVGKKYSLKVNSRAKLVHESPSSKDYKFTSEFYRCSSMMFVRNFYVIMCKNVGKSIRYKMAFLWSILGLILGRVMLHIIYPAEKKKSGLEGIADGLRLVLSGSSASSSQCEEFST